MHYQRQQKLNRVTEYNKTPKTCNHCNLILNYDKRNDKYCSMSCAAKRNGKLYPKRKRATSAANRHCPNCKIDISNKDRHNKFCSSFCSERYRVSIKFERIVLNQKFTNESGATKRSYLFKIKGKKCEVCQLEKWNDNDIPLEIDHINGDYTDNNFTNLRLICCNCHALTDTYKGKNKGKGRHDRRKRYQEGKSY